ncbi:hypothetical protein [Nonomuraea sp. CA-141351]|uniref:hypothetical protein n=1 Tax=Nonomuraea sp. CA-141351 TaxID=3239996 RepID=UPI003D92230A
MPQLSSANSFWESLDALEKPVKAGVRKAMKRFQQLSTSICTPTKASTWSRW